MNIIGPDALVFGVDDVDACTRYLVAYGLDPVGVDERGGRFEGVDGTAIVLRRKDDPNLPPPLESGATLRQTVYGVADEKTVADIADELAHDRQVHRLADRAIETTDNQGF